MPYTDERHAMMYFDEESTVHDSDAEESFIRFIASHPFEMDQQNRSMAAKHFGGGPRV